MQPRGVLMIEHRLIERMIALIDAEAGTIRRTGHADPRFIDAAADFLRTYADRSHHGKEEDILFADLRNKSLEETDAAVMDQLIAEHGRSRELTRGLFAANDRLRAGDDGAVEGIAGGLERIAALYPRHIALEDITFFPATMKYLSAADQEDMLRRFREFDRTIFHAVYTEIVVSLESR